MTHRIHVTRRTSDVRVTHPSGIAQTYDTSHTPREAAAAFLRWFLGLDAEELDDSEIRLIRFTDELYDAEFTT